MRFFIRFSYDGGAYHGWQVQPNAVTVQEKLTEALSTLLRTAIKPIGAGRTDTGVHAREMFAHFDVEKLILEPEELTFRLNRILPPDIAVDEVFRVNDDAHARFDALDRTYMYFLHFGKKPFLRDRSYAFPGRTLDFEAMNKAAMEMYGEHDFSCFEKSRTQNMTSICDLMSAKWENQGDYWVFTVKANRFLRNMVRAIVGTLLEVGTAKMDLKDFKNVLEGGNRQMAGESVPAHALYLSRITYPEKIFYGK